jgi:hypothetical protein
MLRPILALALLTAPLSALAEERCIVCAGGGAARDERPLNIEITSNLEFSRMALTGQAEGHAEIDAQSGSRRIGGGLVGLGGLTMQGRARITGAPMRPVRIDFPLSIPMTTTGGGRAELTDLSTNLPPFPVLDANGVLEFAFGGRLKVTGAGGGTFRARIPISVDYN